MLFLSGLIISWLIETKFNYLHKIARTDPGFACIRKISCSGLIPLPGSNHGWEKCRVEFFPPITWKRHSLVRFLVPCVWLITQSQDYLWCYIYMYIGMNAHFSSLILKKVGRENVICYENLYWFYFVFIEHIMTFL